MERTGIGISVSTIGLAMLLLLGTLGCQSWQEVQRGDEVTSLAQAYRHQFKIGTALNRFQINDTIAEAKPLVTKHFNTITPENLLKWKQVHPQPNGYYFSDVYSYVEFGEQNDMFIVGHTLVWHNQVPDWVFENEEGEPIDRKALLQRMKKHIAMVAGQYKGRIDGWDVVNEAVLDEGGMRPSKWYQIIGEDYVEKAFQYAHEAAPDAELYYNDYNLWKPAKREAAIELVKRLQTRDIPIHGIGMQAHLDIDYPPVEMVEESIQAFSELGIKVMITELDIDVLPDDEDLDAEVLNPYPQSLPDSVQQKLTERYVELFQLFNKYHDNIDRVTFWGLNDGQSWLNNFPIEGRTNYPLLFDREYKPKPALEAIIELIQADSE